MKIKKYIISILIFCILLSFSSISKAGYLEFDNLNINAIIKENGDMQVTEYWKIDIEDTNTLFKNWYLDSSKYSGIENVTVTEVLKDGTRKSFNKINEEMYHVTKDCYYALPVSNGKFEIAWGVQVDNVVKNYELTYTVKDAVKHYEDCYEIYWQFIGEDNNIAAKSVTGTITLENPVLDKNNLRAWAHGPLTGEINIVSNDTVEFSVDKLNKNTYLEVRMAILEENIFTNIPMITSNKNIDNIIEEETIWANEANRIREENTKQTQNLIFTYVSVSILLILFAIFKLKKALKVKKDVLISKIDPVQRYDYFRDIPDETASPAEALFIYKYGDLSNQTTDNGRILSATILNLCLKKRLEFEVNQTKGKDNIIFVIKNTNSNNSKKLTEDEKIVFDLLVEAADYKKDEEEKTTGIKKLTVKELEKYAKKHSEEFIKIFEELNKEVKNTIIQKGKYDEKIVKTANKWNGCFVLYLVFGIFSLPFLLIPGILMFIISGVYYKIYKAMNTLTQKGEDEKEQWQGLKRYMEEFSLLKEKEVPHLVLWEKYLVFATVYGIADKVIKQLKIVYPEITNIDDYTYMNLVYNTAFTTSFINSLDESITNVYSSANASYYNSTSSSGGGYGGGFSRRRRIRRRRPEECGGR